MPEDIETAAPAMPADPLAELAALLARAAPSEPEAGTAATLATADATGRPAARVVLIKQVDRRGLVFFTNHDSRKARELRQNPQAALCFWWPTLERQVRIEGQVTRLPEGESDAYFRSRPRGSQIGAWASRQSAVLAERAELLAEVRALEARFAGAEVPRPPFWGGYRLEPDRIEFWEGREDRLHERRLHTRQGDAWTSQHLYP
jgi:pyridoxamine 5'-phosphate oxidase